MLKEFDLSLVEMLTERLKKGGEAEALWISTIA